MTRVGSSIITRAELCYANPCLAHAAIGGLTSIFIRFCFHMIRVARCLVEKKEEISNENKSVLQNVSGDVLICSIDTGVSLPP